MSSESNIWTPDTDPHNAALEESLTALGSGWLMRVHLDTLRALELPAPTLEQVRTAYNASTVAKAGEAWYSSQKTLERLRAFGKAITPPELFIDLAETVTKKWLEEGRLKTRAARQAVSAYLVGLLKGGRAPATLETPTDEDALALEYARANAGENITALCDRTRHALGTTLIAAQQNGTTPADLSGQLLEKFAALNRDWRRIAISSVSENRSNGELAAAPISSPMRWSAANDACKHCRYHHGKTYTLTTAEEATDGSSQIWVGKSYPPKGIDPRQWPVIPLHGSCFPAGTLISGPKARVGYERWYEGTVVRVKTASGNEFTCTPNHPILTPLGWIPAGQLSVGDHAVRRVLSHRVSQAINPDHQDTETPIEQVVHSLSMISSRMPMSPENFHGDGEGSDVNVVTSDALLLHHRDTALLQPACEKLLCPACGQATLHDSESGTKTLRVRSFSAAHRIMRRARQRQSFLWAGLTHSQKHAFAATARLNANTFETVANHATRNIKMQSETLDRIPGIEKLAQDLEINELAVNDGFALDVIVDISNDKFAGHVYNIETEQGWYISNGIVVHNCRCRWVRADRTPAPDAGVEAMIQRALQQAREF